MATMTPTSTQKIPLSRLKIHEVLSTETSDKMIVSSGNTASRPSTLTASDAGLYGYYDTTTGGFVVWTGTKWTDQ